MSTKTNRLIKASYKVQPRGKSFQCTISCKSLPKGRVRRSFLTQLEADLWGSEQVNRLKHGKPIDLGDMKCRDDERPHTIQELLEYTVKERWSKKATTLKQIQIQAQSLVDTIGPRTPITKCDYFVISNALQRLEEGKGVPARRNSGASCNRKWAYLRVMLGYAVKLGIISAIPEIERRPESPPREFRITPILEGMMYVWAEQHSDQEFLDFLRFGIWVGARENEILKLTLDKTTSTAGFVDGDHITMPHPNSLIKNKGMRRDLLMAPWIKAIADRRRAELQGGNGKLFPTLTKSKINHTWNKMKLDPTIAAEIAKQEHPQDFVPHIMRHEFCSRLGEEGRSAFEIMRLSGHKSTQACERYVKIDRTRSDEVMRQMFANAAAPHLAVVIGGKGASGNAEAL